MASRVIIKCMNEKCNNYKQVLNEGTEICSLCGQPTVKTETNENPKLGRTAIIIGLAAFVISFGGGWILGLAVQIIALLAIPASFVLAVRSKSRLSIVVTLLSFLAGLALFVTNLLYWYI